MRLFRSVKRLMMIGIVTLTYYPAWRVARLLTRRSPENRKRWRSRISRGWASAIARILNFKVTTQGAPPIAPFFLVANHLSYIDIICIAAVLDCVFVARSDLARWPIVGALAKSVDTIFIDRAHHQEIPRAITEIETAMVAGYGIILFPESTSTKGDKVLPFRPSLLEPAARLNLPVYVAAISYHTPPEEIPAFLSVCWWGEMTFIPHFIQMLGLRGCEARIRFAAEPIRNSERKALAQQLWTAVSNEFEPVVTDQEERQVLMRNPEYFPAWY